MPHKISEFLHNFLPSQHMWKIKLFKHWEDIAGDFKDKVIILKIERSVLTLGVSHPAWAQELFCLSDLFKEKINSLLEKDYIKYIRFKVVLRKKSKDFCKNNKFKRGVKRFVSSDFTNFTLSKNEEAKLLPIKDNELKQYLEEFCLRSKRVRNDKNNYK